MVAWVVLEGQGAPLVVERVGKEAMEAKEEGQQEEEASADGLPLESESQGWAGPGLPLNDWIASGCEQLLVHGQLPLRGPHQSDVLATIAATAFALLHALCAAAHSALLLALSLTVRCTGGGGKGDCCGVLGLRLTPGGDE